METLWQEAAAQVKDLVAKPESFLEPSKFESRFEKAKVITKVIYDGAKMVERGPVAGQKEIRNSGK